MFVKLKTLFGTQRSHRKKRNRLFSQLNSGDIFIDCGANIGQETLPALNKGAIVYAFEPNPVAFAELKKKVGTNKNAHLLCQGVGDRATTLKLFMHEHHDRDAVTWSTGSSFVREKKNVNPANFITVAVIDLADFIQKLKQPVKVLKIDVEGVEFEILERLITSGVYKQVGAIFVETHTDQMKHLQPKESSIKKLIAKHNIQSIDLNWV
jgi:FkbM family methyltransferase